MAKALSESAAANIRKNIDGVTADKKGIPGCVAVVVGKDGKTIFSHASGNKGSETQDPMTLDTVFWIASCTKMIGGIAVMQLVEQGKLALDDADLVEKICPELKDVRILQDVDAKGKPTFVEKKNRITLKMLLTHTGMTSNTI
jgi:CubicO group peptidase (beta-lactamase class C family)